MGENMNTVKRTKPSDWKSIKCDIVRIEKTCFERGVRQPKEELKEIFKDDDSLTYIAKKDDNLVGYLSAAPLEECDYVEDYSPKCNSSIYVESIAILPNFQGNGLGDGLMEMFMADSKKEGYSRITLHATSEGMLRLAEKKGFKKLKFEEEWVGERDGWYMEKVLD